jgi:hypothetical protein
MRAAPISRPTTLLGALLLTGSSLLGAALLHWSAGGAGSAARFLLAFTLLVWLPGSRIVGWVGLEVPSRLERASLSVALGMPASALLYWACGYFGVWRLFWAWPLACFLFSRPWRFGGELRDLGRAPVRYGHVLLVAVFFATVAPLFFMPLGFRDLARTESGGLTFYPLADSTLHVSVANELTHTIPPDNPFLPGRTLSYHYGMDLVAAMLALFGASTIDLTVRYVPLLFLSLVVLAGFCLGRRWLVSEAAAALSVFLVVLGEDLSFVPGLLRRPPGEVWSVYFFGMPTFASLYTLNPMLLALGFLLAALLSLERFFTTGRKAWLLAFALLATSLVEVKVFAAALVILGLLLTATVFGLRFRRVAPLGALFAVAALASPFFLGALSGNSGRIVTRLAPFPYVPAAWVRMGFQGTGFMALTGDFYDGRLSLASSVAFLGLALPLYIVLTFGVRMVGLWEWALALVKPRPESAFPFFVAAFALIGVPLSLLLAIGPAGAHGRDYYNNAVWFLVLSKYVAWPFAVAAVFRWARSDRGRGLAALGLIALSVPSTLQMIVVASRFAHPILAPHTVSMMEVLDKEAHPGALCWAEESVAQWVLAATRCRSYALDLFPSSFMSEGEEVDLTRRRELFWDEWRRSPGGRGSNPAIVDTLKALSVDFVVARVTPGEVAAPFDEGAGSILEIAFHNEAFTVYRVRRTQGGAPAAP